MTSITKNAILDKHAVFHVSSLRHFFPAFPVWPASAAAFTVISSFFSSFCAAQLPTLAALPGVRQALTELRERSLLARFGRGRISRAQMQQDLELLRDFVQIEAEKQKKSAQYRM